MELVDTHCHLQFDKLSQRLEDVVQAANAAGVTRLICVGTSLDDSQQAVELAARFDNVWATIGAHPHDGKGFFEDKAALEKLKELYAKPKVVAIGEIGLDFYKNYSPKDDQEKLLRTQIEASLDIGLPYVFHVRDAWQDFWRIFDSYEIKKGVVHSFSANQAHLDEALDRGLYVALNGIMTFTDDETQLAAARLVPKDRLILETDAPFLTPAAKRGKICEPAFTADTAKFLAELRAEKLEDLAKYTTKNAKELFGI